MAVTLSDKPNTVTVTGADTAIVVSGVGIQGSTGPAATVSVGSTSTLAAGAAATVVNSGTSSAAVFDFGIPAGAPGAAATITVGTTSTLTPGSSATVSNSGSSSAAVFNFGIPAGANGQSAQRESRSAWVSPNSYMGIAAKGTAESTALWKVTRITVSGTTVTTAVASPIKWTDRYTATYT